MVELSWQPGGMDLSGLYALADQFHGKAQS
jgi:hypothetical protein